MKVVAADPLPQAALDLFASRGSFQLVASTPKEFTQHIAEADALLVRATRVDRAVLDKAPHLRVIGIASIGVEAVDLQGATAAGVLVMNTPGGNAVSVAEHTFAMMLALARDLTAISSSTLAGQWNRKSYLGHELRGKTLGVIGMGSIGREVVSRAKAFDMNVIACDPYVNPRAAVDLDTQLVPLERIWAESDYITLHVALTQESRGMIDGAALKRMKRGVRIINCAQGALVDQEALAEALRSGHVAGAGIDVFDPEPLPTGHPLLTAPNLIATPHIGGTTEEAEEIVSVRIAEQVIEYLTRGVAVNAVNMPTLSPEQYRALGPYIALAERLGAFAAAISTGNPRSARVTYAGRIADLNTQLLRNASLAGLLNRSLSHKANLVNAMQRASQRGLSVAEVHQNHPTTYADSIQIDLETSEGSVSVEGALVLGDSRLLRVNGIYCEAKLDGCLTYLVNDDVPGVIGFIGGVMGKSGVNIAAFSLGRANAPEQTGAPLLAVSVIETDSIVPDAAVREIMANPAIRVARVIDLHA